MNDPPEPKKQSPKELRQELARDELDYALRVLTANLLRVVRGAGQSYRIGVDMAACAQAAKKYRRAYGEWPSQVLEQILRFESGIAELQESRSREEIDAMEERGLFDRMQAEYEICRGALQIVASDLLGQRIQKIAGQKELYEGVRNLQAARERRHNHS